MAARGQRGEGFVHKAEKGDIKCGNTYWQKKFHKNFSKQEKTAKTQYVLHFESFEEQKRAKNGRKWEFFTQKFSTRTLSNA